MDLGERWRQTVAALNANVLRLTSIEDVRNKLPGPPAIFLSAGLPYQRKLPPELSAEETARRKSENESFLQVAAPEETVRSAVVLLAREILLRGMRLVFGAQPAISAMVLSIGRDVIAAADRGVPRILIFQSAYFEGELPGSTLDLAGWDTGLLVLTPETTSGSPRSDDRRNASLQLMRECMVSVPGLQAGVFVGGMEGVRDEAALFRRYNPDKLMFPLASTGSAARLLYQAAPEQYATALDGPSQGRRISYSLVARDIVDKVSAEPGTQRPQQASAMTQEEPLMGSPSTLSPDNPAVLAHVTMLQGIINRLAGNSASCKTWCIALVSALVSLVAATKIPGLAVVTLVPVIIFGYLDASYLAQEQAYRELMKRMVDKMRNGTYTRADTFEASAKIPPGGRRKAFHSWSIWPMYLTLILLAIVISFLAWRGLLVQAAVAN
jgi:hypothetical protein